MERQEAELFERSLRLAAERCAGGRLDDALDDLGWAEALDSDVRTAVSLLFRIQGEANASSYALDRLFGHRLGSPTDEGVVLPGVGCHVPPGRVEDGRLWLSGLATATTARGDSVLVAARPPRGDDVIVRVGRERLDFRPAGGWDPALGLVQVTADGVPFSESGLGGWDEAVAYGRLALGHELVGCSRAMLRLAREHALHRVQFGRPIATFQALRHRLAEAFVAVEGAQAVLDAAWHDPRLAEVAKALSGRAGRTAARHCQQVLAGIGFTAEHPFHRHLRRVMVLDSVLGSARELTERIGAEVLAAGRLPVELPL